VSLLYSLIEAGIPRQRFSGDIYDCGKKGIQVSNRDGGEKIWWGLFMMKDVKSI
jgi:hypothetical protein